MDIIETIATRRSLGKMRPDAPPRELIERVLEAGVHAANHHDTQPWRFFVLTNEGRSEFGEVLAAGHGVVGFGLDADDDKDGAAHGLVAFAFEERFAVLRVGLAQAPG